MPNPKYNPLATPEMRRHDKYIVLAHISDFPLKTHFIEPDLRNKTTYFALNDVRNYFRNRMELKHMPFHYYTSYIKGNWELFTTAPRNYRSPIIDKAAENFYIDDKFKDAVIICVQDNYALNTPDERMFQMLASNLIAPLTSEFRVNFRDSVFWWDEIFNWEKYEADQKRDILDWSYPYEVNKMLYFDRVMFNLNTIRYT